MARIDPVKFAGMLRELRGERSQDEVATMAKIPRHTIERLEAAETKSPKFEDVVAICRAFELDVTAMAAALDLLPPPGKTTYPLVISEVLTEVRETMMRLDQDEQEKMKEELIKSVKFIEFGIKQDRAKRKPVARGEKKRFSFFPDWWHAMRGTA